MTSYVTPEQKMEQRLSFFRNALSKLAPHQTEEILLVFSMAADVKFGFRNPARRVIETMGREESALLSLDEFLAAVEREPLTDMPKIVMYMD